MSWAITVDDIDAAREAAQNVGFEPGDIVDGARTTEDGTELSWRMVNIGEGPFDPIYPFLIQWDTPMPDLDQGPVLVAMCTGIPDPTRLDELLTALDFHDDDVTLGVSEGEQGLVSATFRTQESTADVLELDGLTVNLH
ncbi:hypothetical protein BSZ39_11365 [Bowdeniella nasicola]|uniref:Glyoxalase-like domain-containing protein n=1 Tax=Bowdeniella nasicola TaxID=208480 RepID=A0A1Q5PZM2_9ACTO|nr:hypothetical protein BSZ39_11365 [Bowdeniella nasicola]